MAGRLRPATGYTGRMSETTLYERLLGIERPWQVCDVRLALEQGDVEVGVEFVGETLVCPACGEGCPGYDRRRRTWRHLDTMQVPDAGVGRGASDALRRARGPTCASTVGGCAVAFHGAVRGDGARLAVCR